jgi:hypothetical protein
VNISVAIQSSAILQFVRVEFSTKSACKCDRYSIFEICENSDGACRHEICGVDACRVEIFGFCEVEIEIFEFQISRVLIDYLFRHIDLFANEF